MAFEMNMLAYCGLYCEQCSVRTAFIEQNAAHLTHIPARYGKNDADLSTCDCEGCKGRNLCGPCKIKDCAVPRGIASCADCGDFPCGVVAAFGSDGAPHHHQALANLNRIREIGVEAWFAELEPSLRCHCGERLSWYYACPRHGDDGNDE